MSGRHPVVPPIFLLLGLLASVALHFYAPLWVVLPWPLNLSGVVILLAGMALTGLSAGRFRALGTPVRPFLPPTTLVISGAFRFTRNPMYVGMAAILVGVALLCGTASAFLPVPLFVWQIRRKFVLPEEAFMEETFGQPYRDYKDRVRRWL